MEFIAQFIEIILHLEKYLTLIVKQYGGLTYGVLFFIVFMETGFVITPFLPGDSLLFAAGALTSTGSLELPVLLILLASAAIAGDTVNYWIGRTVGPKVFRQEKGLVFNKEHLVRTEHFYAKHGAKTIVLARFLPIVRTFAPFIAGIGKMHYPKFLAYNVLGGLIWIFLFTVAGFYFGNLPYVKANFSYVVLAIILISILPLAVELTKSAKRKITGRKLQAEVEA